MKRNFGEGLIPLVLGLLSVALLCWDNVFIPWYEKKYEGKEEEIAKGPVMKIFNWILRIIGLAIVLGVFGWLIYDIFFQGEEVKARVLIGPLLSFFGSFDGFFETEFETIHFSFVPFYRNKAT